MDAVVDAVGSKRFCFVSGKGGVGKTSCSCALATELAARGKKVLLISTDPAHNVSDALGVPVGNTATAVPECQDRLWAIESDPSGSLDRLLGEASRDAASQANPDLFEQMQEMMSEMRSWLSSLPGIDEAVALLQILDAENNDQYDNIVLDTAPTGHTLKLLALPKLLNVGIERLQGWQVKLGQYVRMAMMFFKPPSNDSNQTPPAERLAEKLKQLKQSVEKLKAILTDKLTTTFLCVGIAETLSVMETGRLLASLQDSGIHSQVMVINHLYTRDFLDQEEQDSEASVEEPPAKIAKHQMQQESVRTLEQKALTLCKSRARLQKKHMDFLFSKHGQTHKIIQIPELAYEPRGVGNLRKFANTWAS